MFNQLGAHEKLAVAVASSVLAAVALLVCLNLTIAPSYSDFVVGYIAWHADAKLQDLIAAPIFIAVLCLGFIFFTAQLAKQKHLFGKDYSTKLSDQLIWWSLPAIAAISSLILGSSVDRNLFYLSACGIGFIAIASSFNRVKEFNVSPEVISQSVFAIFLIGLIPLELALVRGRAPTMLFSDTNLAHYEMATYVTIVFGLLAGLFTAISYPEKLARFLPKLVFAGQIGLPTFFLTIYPARLLQGDGVIEKYQTTWGLKFIVIGLVVLGIFDVVRCYRKYGRTSGGSAVHIFSPFALFALLVALTVGNTIIPSISPDDYHFGESLIGWWSYLRGTIPYVGYLPAHGLIDDDLRGVLSLLFYDGSAGSIADAGRITFVFLALAGFVSIYRFTGNIALAFISMFFIHNVVVMSAGFKWIFFIPFLCLWFSRSLVANPARWLSVWMLTVPIVFLGVPPQGLLLVTASGVMAAYMAWIFWRDSNRRDWKEIWLALVLLLVLAVVTPLVPMMIGALLYVLENGPINQLAYGVPWEVSWRSASKSGLVFEAIRMSWVAVPIVCLGIILTVIKDSSGVCKSKSIPAMVVLLFSLLLIPYAMGRIDPEGISRPGLFAIFGWAVLLPIALWGLLKPNMKSVFIALVVCMSSTLSVIPLFPSQNLVSSTFSRINTGPLRDGQAVGMPNIGLAYVQDEHWNGLVKLNALLNDKLLSGETYLDLTGRHAQYFYMDREPVIAVTAPYNMTPMQQQKRAVSELLRDLPRVALLKSNAYNMNHDGGGLALRNPYLYQFIIDNYIPSFEDGFIIGVKKNTKSLDEQSLMIDVSVEKFTDANWNQGVHREQPAVMVTDSILLALIKVGDQVRIRSDELRRVAKVWTEGKAIWFEGTSFEPIEDYHPINIHLSLSPESSVEYRASLFQRAFSTSDFAEIPVAWGKSVKTLEKKMTLIRELDEVAPSFHHLIPENGSYSVNGIDPILSFDILSLGLSGRDAGLLKFDFSCMDRSLTPRIQVFWWGDDRTGPFEASSIRFTADDGTLIVPLDSDPRWLALKKIKGIRIDLDNSSACSAVSVRNIGLFQRLFL